jgi:N-methylhydantoinase B
MLRASRFHVTVREDDAVVAYTGAKGRRRILQLSPADMAALGAADGDLIEMLGRHPAPLRAWLRSGAETPGCIRLDRYARLVLGVADGDRVRLRSIAVPPLPNGMAG